jgi:GNAT superfamily N-acetyltransferase
MSFLSMLFGEDVAGRIGPSYQGYLEPTEFCPDRHHPVRSLSASDRPMLEALLEACPLEERADSGIDPDGRPSVGSFADGTLVAAAQYRERSSCVGDPCVLTRTSHRGARHGAAVVSAVVERALDRGALVIYQTLLSNLPAIQLAQRLGFRSFACVVAVTRLR